MQSKFTRTRMLLGQPAIDTLEGSRVAVFGVGGVGGYAVEALARSGVGELDIFDNDTVCLTNVNRQIYALTSTIGQYKVDVAERRIKDINPQCIVHKYRMFYLPSKADEVDLSIYDYVVDCIDTVSAKIELAKRCYSLGTPIISCMGAANKMDATAFRVCDIGKTKMDPLAKVMRKKMKELGVKRLKVVYSEETPLHPFDDESANAETAEIVVESLASNNDSLTSFKTKLEQKVRRNTPASNAFVPAAAGLIVGGEVVKDLINAAGTMRLSPEQAEQSEAAAKAKAKAEAHRQRVNDAMLRDEDLGNGD